MRQWCIYVQSALSELILRLEAYVEDSTSVGKPVCVDDCWSWLFDCVVVKRVLFGLGLFGVTHVLRC